MRYYLDTEFAEDGRSITLISIGIVAEDGSELYAISSEFRDEDCNDWVKANVLPLLSGPRYPRTKIATMVRNFIGADPDSDSPEFWAYFADYDWVLFCQLFGTMQDLPIGWPMLCMDLKQYAIHLGIKESLKNRVPQATGVHNALEDARWNKTAHEYLMEREAKRRGYA